MRSIRLTALALALSLPVAALMTHSVAFAQNTTSGDLQGTITDPTGAAVPGAAITVTGVTTGSVQKLTAGASGAYRVSFLKPGSYTISVNAPNFETTTVGITIAQGSTTSGNIKLTVGKASTTVEVGANTVPLLQTEDAQISTTFTQEQVQALPNPGGDITYYAQTAPAVVMNTGGGYGNFSVFGLPGTANNFTVNGEQENDPFLNLNNSGPTNLLLGQNDISSVSVITSAYGSEFGSFGGAQVNEISRSGSNKFHGDASYWWNGRSINANDWFLKQSQIGAGGSSANFFSNDNQWAASIGGPIIKDKTFFFVDTEGIRFITAPSDTVFIPNQPYQLSIVGNDRACDNATSSLFESGTGAGGENECAIYNQMFALFNNAPGAGGATATANPYASSYVATPRIFAKESLVTARVDQVIGAKDTAFVHFKYDNGTQPSNVDPISPIFNDISNQPEYEGQLVETHTFTPNLTNQFLATIAHYGAVFQSVDQAAATAALPFGAVVFGDGYFNNLGGAGYAFPQGRNATQYQFADDLSWTKKNHTIKAGYAWKKDDITNFDDGIYTNPLVVTLEDPGDGLFTDGFEYYYRQTFPTHLSNPNSLYSEGFYVQDSYKPNSKILLTAGIRAEVNSNPACPHNCFSRLNQNFSDFLGSASNTQDTPYNSVLLYGLGRAFNKYQTVSYEPRLEVVYSPSNKTVVRGGFGMFSDVFPGQVADNLMRNTPQDPRFQPLFGTVDPSLPDSGTQLAAGANATFTTGEINFFNGGTYNQLHGENSGIVRPNLSTADQSMHYPTYEEYSLQIQREVAPNTTIQVGYAGNHGYHEPVEGANANAYGPGLASLPTSRPGASFGTVTTLSSIASSHYDGLLVSVIHHSKILTAQLNYTYSHTLDQVSNGGFLGFTGSSITGPIAPNTLKYNYGNADYDVRNSLNGNYLVNVPSYGSGLVKSLTGGFQIAGTVFYRSGFPFTVTDSNISNGLALYSGGIPAALVAGTKVNHNCNGRAAVSTTGCLNIADFTDPTDFIPGQRNAFSGPHYFNTDTTINKAFALPYEGIKLTVGAVFYNILNHPNFGNPVSDIGNPSFGQTFNTVSVPTSIYGAGLGGDAAPRIIQLHAKVSF